MATPYLQFITDVVPSTQDVAREKSTDLPQVVIASGQSHGRGRSGAEWMNAERALAVSVAWHVDDDDARPFSLMAGIAAVRALEGVVSLKWPNDVVVGDSKAGGILVERSEGIVVAGLGLNLYWPDPPHGVVAVMGADPGPHAYKDIGALWAAEFLDLVDGDHWPVEEYRRICRTLGRDIVWEPNGSGIAAGVSPDGALIVETSSGMEQLYAGAVRHVRD